MRWPSSFLDQIRAALPVVDVVKRHHKLRKDGASEWRAVTDQSLTVNTSKNLWYDHGKYQRGGDIFEWEMFATGCTFDLAVERCAGVAGLPLPDKRRARSSKVNGHAAADMGPEPSAAYWREITATYDYSDADGAMICQVCRQEWIEDGKREKTFFQRRPHGPVEADPAKQCWIIGLREGVYLRNSIDSNFYLATDERLAKPFWRDAERIEVEECPHILYRLPELREEMAQNDNERWTIFVEEGEKNVDTLVAWGCVATTNSGGAGNWRPEHAEEFRGADVVILENNDEKGRKRTQAIGTSLQGKAKRLRVLRWPEHWPECGPGNDVTDWQEKAGGDAVKFGEIVDKLLDWKPPDNPSGWTFHGTAPQTQPRWTIKGLIPESGVSIFPGQWGMFKTTLALDFSVSVMTGLPFAGRYKVKRAGAVAYFALEGAGVIGARLSAIARHRGIITPLPFAWRDACPPLTADNAAEDICKLLHQAEIEQRFQLPLALIWVDTMIAAAGYAATGDDNDTAATQKVITALRNVSRQTSAFIFGIDHFGKIVDAGTRGSSAKEGGADTVLAALADRDIAGTVKNTRLSVRKQRDGHSGFEIPFAAQTVETGRDEDNDPITAVVIEWSQPQQAAGAAKGQKWTKALQLLRRVLMTILADAGQDRQPFPDGPTVRAVDVELVRQEFYRQRHATGTEDQKAGARHKAFGRAIRDAQAADLINCREIDGVQLVWLIAKPET
jgi:hypothetical protein